MIIINGENLIMGRVLSRIAKYVLLGEEVALINCEKLMISGAKNVIISRQRFLADLKGKPNRGRFYYSGPSNSVKRSLRGMLPVNNRGKLALARVKCYTGIPDEFKNQKQETFQADNISKLPNMKYMAVADICKEMGGTW